MLKFIQRRFSHKSLIIFFIALFVVVPLFIILLMRWSQDKNIQHADASERAETDSLSSTLAVDTHLKTDGGVDVLRVFCENTAWGWFANADNKGKYPNRYKGKFREFGKVTFTDQLSDFASVTGAEADDIDSVDFSEEIYDDDRLLYVRVLIDNKVWSWQWDASKGAWVSAGSIDLNTFSKVSELEGEVQHADFSQEEVYGEKVILMRLVHNNYIYSYELADAEWIEFDGDDYISDFDLPGNLPGFPQVWKGDSSLAVDFSPAEDGFFVAVVDSSGGKSSGVYMWEYSASENKWVDNGPVWSGILTEVVSDWGSEVTCSGGSPIVFDYSYESFWSKILP